MKHIFINQIEPFSKFVEREVPDPRGTRGRKYKMSELIDLILIGFIAGKTDLVAISTYIKENLDVFNTLLGLERAPSHDCFNDFINTINPNFLEMAFESWVNSYYKPQGLHQVAGDGTFIRGSTDKIRKGKQPNLVNFVSAETNLVLASELTMGKGGNETQAFIRVIKRMDLEDCLITGDALNCTQWIMDYIDEQGGYYFFPVKKDKKKLRRRIIEVLVENLDSTEEFHQGFRVEHGVLVDRRVTIFRDVDKLKVKGYPSIKQFGLIESTRMTYFYDEKGERVIDKVSFEYYGIISNFECSAEKAAMIKLDEWVVETFHNYKDDFLEEDQKTNKKQNGINVLAILRRVAYNYLVLSEKLISDFERESLSEKSIFLDAHKDLLIMLVSGYNPDYASLMQNYHEKKARSYEELGKKPRNKEPLDSLILANKLDLLDF